jgi:CRP-like cAMP-binding protein
MDSSELGTAGALSNVADEDRAALAEIMRIEDRPRGHVLVEEGDIPDKFF